MTWQQSTMTSAGEITNRSSNSQPQCCSEIPYGQNIPPAYFQFGSHPQVVAFIFFSQLSFLNTSKLRPVHHLLPLPMELHSFEQHSKYQISEKCFCRLKLTCKISFASLVLNPHAVKLSLSTLEGIKATLPGFLDLVCSTEYHQCYRDTKLQLFFVLLANVVAG